MPHRAVGTKFLAVKGGDSSGFLPAMLERVEAERDHRGGAVGAAYTKNAALLAELVVVERMGRQHDAPARWGRQLGRSEEHTSELQSLMRISYAVFCLKKKKRKIYNT